MADIKAGLTPRPHRLCPARCQALRGSRPSSSAGPPPTSPLLEPATPTQCFKSQTCPRLVTDYIAPYVLTKTDLHQCRQKQNSTKQRRSQEHQGAGLLNDKVLRTVLRLLGAGGAGDLRPLLDSVLTLCQPRPRRPLGASSSSSSSFRRPPRPNRPPPRLGAPSSLSPRGRY